MKAIDYGGRSWRSSPAMQSASLFLAAATLTVVAAFVGCGSDEETGGSAAATSSVAGVGGGVNEACNEGGPDGYCVTEGAAEEPCTCADCTATARCVGGCQDNGVCDFEGGEDCTCTDCLGKVPECPPYNVGCNDGDGICELTEDCTCDECTNTPRCTDNCVDNGACVPYLEGCSCADCQGTDACGGSSSNTTTTTTTTSTTSTSASTTGAGGGGGSGVGGGGGTGGS